MGNAAYLERLPTDDDELSSFVANLKVDPLYRTHRQFLDQFKSSIPAHAIDTPRIAPCSSTRRTH